MKATQDMSQHGPSMRPGLHDPEAPSPANSASLLWSDGRFLGFGPMNTTHEEFYAVAFTLLTCKEAAMLQALDAFETHARKHFEQEDKWMRSTEFPPRDCHIQEHAGVLNSMQEVREHITSGKGGLELVHHFAAYLFQWFPDHADYLDSALAAWMTKRSLGGKPVVLRRSLKT